MRGYRGKNAASDPFHLSWCAFPLPCLCLKFFQTQTLLGQVEVEGLAQQIYAS